MTENKLIVWHSYHTCEIVRNSLEMLFFIFMVHKERFEKSDIICCLQELHRVEPNKLFNLNTSPYLDNPLTKKTIDL